MSNNFVVVPAPGHYGDRTTVISSHSTAEAARKAAATASGSVFRAVAREATKRKGDEWLRVYEETSPVV